MQQDHRCLIRDHEVADVPELTFRHPLNPKSEVSLRSLSALAGLQRIGLHIGRLSPGAESFVYHYHHCESVGHHLRNPFPADLVYLMGGESREVEIGKYPRLGKRAIFEKGRDAYIVDLDATQPFLR